MNKIETIAKKRFVRNVMTVATGTVAAQAMNLLFAPIITRLYGPEAFGVLGVFTTIINIVAPMIALTYPIAIVLPKKERDALTLAKISFYITIIISSFLFVVLLLFKDYIFTLFQIQAVAPFLLLIPIVVFFAGCVEIAKNWLIRKKMFAISAKVTFLQALILNSSKVGIGWLNPVAASLISVSSFGHLLNASLLYYNANKGDKTFKNIFFETEKNFNRVKALLKKYRNFPFYRAPQVSLNAILQGVPVILLTSFFGPASAGFYSIGKTVLALPSQLIGQAVGDVFYPRISEAGNSGENITQLIKKATIGLSFIGIVPFGGIMLFGPWMFELVFGDGWGTAGEYARWIALFSLFTFIDRPSVKALPVLSAQAFHLIFTILSLIIRSLALIVGSFFFDNDLLAVALFGISGAMMSVLLMGVTFNMSKNFDKKKKNY